MKLIVGLGNPGREYAATRHNAGWWAVDHLADKWGLAGWRRDGQALTASGRVNGYAVRLLKPQTYMNLSGNALVAYCRRPTWVASTDLMVIVDEPAGPNGALTVAGVTDGTQGTTEVAVNRFVVYRPTAGASGIDTFTYTASDGKAVSNPATVTVAISPMLTRMASLDSPFKCASGNILRRTTPSDMPPQRQAKAITAMPVGLIMLSPICRRSGLYYQSASSRTPSNLWLDKDSK